MCRTSFYILGRRYGVQNISVWISFKVITGLASSLFEVSYRYPARPFFMCVHTSDPWPLLGPLGFPR
jgi:hypothetical protein